MEVISDNYGKGQRTASFRPITDFGVVDITEPAASATLNLFTLRVNQHSPEDLIFLDQLRYAVEEAIRWLRSS